MSAIPLFLDVDTGRDDAWQILGAMKQFNLAGIVASYGNTTLSNAIRNSRDMIELGEETFQFEHLRGDTKVWAGANAPLHPQSPAALAEIERRAAINGNGLCNLTPDLDQTPEGVANRLRHWQTDVRLSVMSHAAVDYVVSGPLTNLAHLVDDFPNDGCMPSFLDHIRKVVVVGGSFDPSLSVDFNLRADPVAAERVFRTFGNKVTLVPFDETLKLGLTESEAKSLHACDEAGEFSRALMVAHARRWSPDKTVFLHDPTSLLVLEGALPTVTQKFSVLQTGPDAGKLVEDSACLEVNRVKIAEADAASIRDRILQDYLGLFPAHPYRSRLPIRYP